MQILRRVQVVARLDLVCLAVSGASLGALQTLAHARTLLCRPLVVYLVLIVGITFQRSRDVLLFVLLLDLIWFILISLCRFVQDVGRILRQNANGVIRLLDDGHFSEDLGFELSLFFLVGLLLDVVDLEPRIIEQILRRRTSVIVDVQASLENVEVLACYLLVVDVISSSLDATIQIVVCLAAEREASVQESIEEDSSCPDVGRRSRVLHFGHNLRCHVGRRSAEHADLLVVWDAR